MHLGSGQLPLAIVRISVSKCQELKVLEHTQDVSHLDEFQTNRTLKGAVKCKNFLMLKSQKF